MDTSKKGRSYRKGEYLSEDTRQLIIDELVILGADKTTGSIPRTATSAVADKFRVHRKTVIRAWSDFLTNGNVKPYKRRGNPSGTKLDEEQTRYVEMLKRETPSIQLQTIKEKLEENANVTVSCSTICRTIRSRLHRPWTRKIMHKPAGERFTYDNLRYTETFLQLIVAADPVRLRFFDESGFNTRDCRSRYGHSEKGTRCVEVERYAKSTNLTLNLMIGMDGVKYANTLQGPSDTDTFLQFFAEAANADMDTGSALSCGDIVVIDNAPIHHHRARDVLTPFLENLGIELIYTPRYSPDFNPCEFAFGHLKTLIRNPNYRGLVHDNLEVAIYKAIQTISASDTKSFFLQTGLFKF